MKKRRLSNDLKLSVPLDKEDAPGLIKRQTEAVFEVEDLVKPTESDFSSITLSNHLLAMGSTLQVTFLSTARYKEVTSKLYHIDLLLGYINSLLERRWGQYPSEPGWLIFYFDQTTDHPMAAQSCAQYLHKSFIFLGIDSCTILYLPESHSLVVKQAALEAVFKMRGVEIDSRLTQKLPQNKNINHSSNGSGILNEDKILLSLLREVKAYAYPFNKDYLIFEFDLRKHGFDAANRYANALNNALVSLENVTSSIYVQSNDNLLIVEKEALEAVFRQKEYKLFHEIIPATPALKQKLQFPFRNPNDQRFYPGSQPYIVASPLTPPASTSNAISDIATLDNLENTTTPPPISLEPAAKRLAIASKEAVPLASLSRSVVPVRGNQVAFAKAISRGLQSAVQQLQEILEQCSKEASVDLELREYAELLSSFLSPLSERLLFSEDSKEIIAGARTYKEATAKLMDEFEQKYPVFYAVILAPLVQKLTPEIRPQNISQGRG